MTKTGRSSPSSRREFAETRRSIVAAAREGGQGSAYRRAMEELARTYWPPLYAYLRRHGKSPQQAEDLMQAFFARLIERNDLRSVDSAKGRFRSFVLAALRPGEAKALARLDHSNIVTPYEFGRTAAGLYYFMPPG